MKIALVHDYLKEPGGAEAVLAAFKEIWPEAPVYTAFKFPKFWGRMAGVMSKWEIHESWGKYLPFLPNWISYYTAISPKFFSSMDLSDFDVVIVSQTGGYFPNAVKIGPQTKLITYCHTPPRFLYGYPTATSARYKWYWRPVSAAVNHFLRMTDFELAQRPLAFIANSKNVANRIRKFYRREAEVVYPPIEGVRDFKKAEKGDYFLIISRIVGSKNIELAVAAANKYKFKLKIAGRPIGASGKEIVSKINGQMVEYLGEVSEQRKAELLAQAKGFLALEAEADFGMTTVEPQMYGMPVVAFRKGGYLETVEGNKTGVFVNELTLEGVNAAIIKFNKLKWNTEYIKKQAKRFSKEEFKKRMVELVSKYAGTA